MKKLTEQNGKLIEEINDFKVKRDEKSFDFRFVTENFVRSTDKTGSVPSSIGRGRKHANSFHENGERHENLRNSEFLQRSAWSGRYLESGDSEHTETKLRRSIDSETRFPQSPSGFVDDRRTNAENLLEERSRANKTERRRQIRPELSRRALPSESSRKTIRNNNSSYENRLSTSRSSHSSRTSWRRSVKSKIEFRIDVDFLLVFDRIKKLEKFLFVSPKI